MRLNTIVWDKAQYFVKLCEDASISLRRAQEDARNLRKALETDLPE